MRINKKMVSVKTELEGLRDEIYKMIEGLKELVDIRKPAEYICPCCGSLNKLYNPMVFVPQTQCLKCGKLIDVTFEYDGYARAMYLGIKNARIKATMGTLCDTFDLEYTLIDENHFERVVFIRRIPMLQGEERLALYKRMLSRMLELLINNPDCVGIELDRYWMKEIK